jgi:ketosteroid isomerase-like protein
MSDIQAIIAANQAFYRAFEKKDIAAMSAVWSQGSGSICIHPGRPALKGWQSIRASWEQIFQNTTYMEIEIEFVVTETSGNLAYAVLHENILQVVRGRRLEAQTIATNVFELMSQEWYLVHHHGSPLLR